MLSAIVTVIRFVAPVAVLGFSFFFGGGGTGGATLSSGGNTTNTFVLNYRVFIGLYQIMNT